MFDKNNSLFKELKLGILSRRNFFKFLAQLIGGLVSAVGALRAFPINLSFMKRSHSSSQIVPPDDPRLETKYIKYLGASGEIRAYEARPKTREKLPGVVVIHENRGLVPHIEDITRRTALEGFHAIAPDALSPFGGTPANPDEARALIQKLDRQENIKNFVAAVAYLKTNPQTTGKVAVMGFCWGGGVTSQVAVNCPDLDAAVPFYGLQPAPEDVPKIKAAMLIHYAEKDDRINAGIPPFEEALKKAGVDYKIYIYEGTSHAFMNDTGARYHPEAATLAWRRTIAFLKEKLKS
ncbi:MAG: dienelactone hydrolase family protein [Candidatus Aminicenantes bacterium]|nr:dienelactone hydrolase family protein [Candidatus Aminicenantes bacterium]